MNTAIKHRRMAETEAINRLENLDPHDPGVTVRDASTLSALSEWVTRKNALASELGDLVTAARETGMTWEDIGARLGLSKQAVHHRFATFTHNRSR
jgi:hypothetical protein